MYRERSSPKRAGLSEAKFRVSFSTSATATKERRGATQNKRPLSPNDEKQRGEISEPIGERKNFGRGDSLQAYASAIVTESVSDNVPVLESDGIRSSKSTLILDPGIK